MELQSDLYQQYLTRIIRQFPKGFGDMRTGWSLKQHFSLRASTLLILYVPIIAFIGYLGNWIPHVMLGILEPCINGLISSVPLLMLISAIFAMAFFVASVYRRRPQIQFLLEVSIAVNIILWIPAY